MPSMELPENHLFEHHGAADQQKTHVSGSWWVSVVRSGATVALSGTEWDAGVGRRDVRRVVIAVRLSMEGASLHNLKTRSTGFILTHTAVLFFRPASFGSTGLHFRVPCCGVVRLSAQDVKGQVAAQGQCAHLRV